MRLERPKLIKTMAMPIADVDEKRGYIKGVFAHIGSLDKHGDIIQKTAFNKTIKELGPSGTNEIAHLLDHKGDHAVAVIKELGVVGNNLEYGSEIGTHNAGVDFAKMVMSGIIKFHSIGYSIIKQFYDAQSKANLLQELILYEGSSLQFIASNHNTPVLGLKSMEEMNDYFYLLEKFIRTTDATDLTIIELEKQLKSLSELIKAGKSTLTITKADLENKLDKLYI